MMWHRMNATSIRFVCSIYLFKCSCALVRCMFVALHCYRKKEHVMQGEPPFQQSTRFAPVPPFGEVRSPKAEGKYKKSAKKAEKECNIPGDHV